MHRTTLVGVLLGVVLLTQTAHAQIATTTDAAPITTPSTQTSFNPFDPVDIEAKVRRLFADAPVMIRIAKCESDFTQYDATGHPLYGGTGGMVGVFQEAAALHNDTSQALGFNINTLDGNLGYARYLYDTEGTKPWLGSVSCWDPVPITSVLQVGSKGTQVKILQQLLNANGYTIAKSGDGSPGYETGVFGPMTRDAVKKFQCDQRVVCTGDEKSTGYGMVGEKTRLALIRVDAETAQAHDVTSLSQK